MSSVSENSDALGDVDINDGWETQEEKEKSDFVSVLCQSWLLVAGCKFSGQSD